jgi:hypothetical protein
MVDPPTASWRGWPHDAQDGQGIVLKLRVNFAKEVLADNL